MADIIPQTVEIPENIRKYIEERDGANLNISFNSASGDYGYGHMIWYTVEVSIITRTCLRCGYDPIWNPDDTESKCNRHRYSNWRYDTVFAWSDKSNPVSLSKCFELFERANKLRSYNKPIQKLHFGEFGWR